MPRGGYADVNWFVRAARVVPVIAGAALVGGMIGGFAMFAIDSALTWEPVSQPRPDGRAEGQASALVAQPTKPVRIVGGAIPDPSAGMSAPPPAPQPRSVASADFVPVPDAEAARAGVAATAKRNNGIDLGRAAAAKSNGVSGASRDRHRAAVALARCAIACAPKRSECGKCE